MIPISAHPVHLFEGLHFFLGVLMAMPGGAHVDDGNPSRQLGDTFGEPQRVIHGVGLGQLLSEAMSGAMSEARPGLF